MAGGAHPLDVQWLRVVPMMPLEERATITTEPLRGLALGTAGRLLKRPSLKRDLNGAVGTELEKPVGAHSQGREPPMFLAHLTLLA